MLRIAAWAAPVTTAPRALDAGDRHDRETDTGDRGPLVCTVALVLLSRIDADASHLDAVFPAVVVLGLGLAAIMIAIDLDASQIPRL